MLTIQSAITVAGHRALHSTRLHGWAADPEVLALAEQLRELDRDRVPLAVFQEHASLVQEWEAVGLARSIVASEVQLTPTGRALIFGLSEYHRWLKIEAPPEVQLLRQAGLGPRPVVLDVGCGAGVPLLGLLPLAPQRLIGVDPEPMLLRLADAIAGLERARLGANAPTTWVLGRAETLPAASASVDAVLCRNAFHLLRTAEALAEMARVLRPGGVVVLQFHDWAFYARRLVEGRVRRLLPDTIMALLLGATFHCTGRQMQMVLGARLWSEVYHSVSLFQRLGAPLRLAWLSTVPRRGNTCPMCVLRKLDDGSI